MTVQYKSTDLINKISQNNYSYTHSFTKKITEADASIEKLQDKAESFKKSVKRLKRYSAGGISRDLLESQVEDLVKSYNDMKNSADKVTDKNVLKQIAKLEKLFSDNEKDLKKIGVEKTGSKYTFDTKTFGDAADKTINTLFTGHDSFIGKVDKIMRKVDETASEAQYDTNEYKINQTHKYQAEDILLADYMTLAGQNVSTLKSCNVLVQSGSLSDDTARDLGTVFASFAQFVYRTDSTTENKNLDKLNQLCLDQKDQLARLGLKFNNDGKKLTYTAIDMTTSDFKDAYNALFGNNAAFGNNVAEYCKDIFNDIIQPDRIGVSIIDAKA